MSSISGPITLPGREHAANAPSLVRIQKFSDASIQRAIDDALTHVSKDKPVAVVAHATMQGVKLTAVARIGDDWTIMAAAFKDWHGGMGAEAKVVWTP
jgi:hypothetical protein